MHKLRKFGVTYKCVPNFSHQIEDAVSSGISEAEQIVKSEIEDIKEAAVAEESTEKAEEKVEETTSEKPSNVEWSSDEQAPKEASTGSEGVSEFACSLRVHSNKT